MKKLQDSRILIVHSTPYNRKMLSSTLQLMGVKNIENAFESSDALSIAQENDFDVIIAEMTTGVNDAIALTKDLRQNAANKNHRTPVLAIASHNSQHLIEDAREAGITDLLKTPYSADHISERVLYAINIPAEEQIEEVKQITVQVSDDQTTTENTQATENKDWPNTEESNALTNTLMDHYMRHHEVILTKLRYAQDATKARIDDIDAPDKENTADQDSTQKSELKDFGAMWDNIITMFVEGGLSEKVLFDIDKIIKQIPGDIKDHYDGLTGKDVDFMARLKKLNDLGYEEAKEKTTELQQEPNPLTGKTAKDYTHAITSKAPKAKESGSVKAIIYDPIKQKMISKSYEDS